MNLRLAVCLIALSLVGVVAAQDAAPQAERFPTELGFDAKGADFKPWLRGFTTKVRRNWFVPASASSTQGAVTVTFLVHRDGTITDVAIAKVSEVVAFNRSARNAIEMSSPVDPLPAQYPDESVKFTLAFYFNDVPPPPAQSAAPPQ